MSKTIDIRNDDDNEIIKKIIYGKGDRYIYLDKIEDDIYIPNRIVIRDYNNKSIIVFKTDLNNLIKALQKARELLEDDK